MTVEIYNYLQRIKRLIPKDHYHRVKKNNPRHYLHQHMKQIKDDIDSIYWYSFFYQKRILPPSTR